MLETAMLCDLRSAKIVAQHTFLREKVSPSFIQDILEKFYELEISDSSCHQITVEDRNAIVCRITPNLLLIGLSSLQISEDELQIMKQMRSELTSVYHGLSRPRDDDFRSIVDRIMRKRITICFLSSLHPLSSDSTGIAIQEAILDYGDESQFLTRPIPIGPFAIHIARISPEEVPEKSWPDHLHDVLTFIIVLSKELDDAAVINEIVSRIRSNSKVPILIVPSSNEFLERARKFEMDLNLDLCDSVSPDPIDLLLSVLPIAGFTDIHEELAKKVWILPKRKQSQTDETTKAVGHQAFFVVNRLTGRAEYSYYYKDQSHLLSLAPNLVAAISMFRINSSDPTGTAVLRMGNFNYAMIEKDDLIFTLVTGELDDIELIRGKFAHLPELYFEEPPPPIEDPTNLYKSPPFTLKLLATIPPMNLIERFRLVRVKELDWEQFADPLVQSFLKMVYQSIDGKKTIADFLQVSQSGLVIGAIHLLLRLGAIDAQLKVFPDDIPLLTGDAPENLYSLYSHLSRILPKIDGKKTIAELAKEVGVDQQVLLTVLTDLYKKGVIRFIG